MNKELISEKEILDEIQAHRKEKRKKLTKEDVIVVLQSNMELLELDFEDKHFGKIAKILHKHYKTILRLVEVMEND